MPEIKLGLGGGMRHGVLLCLLQSWSREHLQHANLTVLTSATSRIWRCILFYY